MKKQQLLELLKKNLKVKVKTLSDKNYINVNVALFFDDEFVCENCDSIRIEEDL